MTNEIDVAKLRKLLKYAKDGHIGSDGAIRDALPELLDEVERANSDRELAILSVTALTERIAQLEARFLEIDNDPETPLWIRHSARSALGKKTT